MLNIGAHMSIAKGYFGAGKDALSIDSNTFQFFTRNPRGGSARAFNKEDVEKLEKLMEENNFAPILAHSPYTLNMASPKEETREFAKSVFRDDLDILNKIPCNLYNFHPGSHVGDGVEVGIDRIVNILNETIKDEDTTFVLLETMSGKGSEIGRNFEELREIIDRVKLEEKMGVCLDTCHVFCAGYDIVSDLDGVLTKFDKVIGLNRLKAVHLNDTMNDFNSNKDRHAKLGEGFLGKEAIINFINHEKIKNLPILLETPNELEGYKQEIEFLRENFKG